MLAIYDQLYLTLKQLVGRFFSNNVGLDQLVNKCLTGMQHELKQSVDRVHTTRADANGSAKSKRRRSALVC